MPVFEFRITLPPGQNEVGPTGVIVAAGPVVSVVVITLDVSEQPPRLLTITSYEPAPVTCSVLLVAPEILTPPFLH